jgi:hypothetical protein
MWIKSFEITKFHVIAANSYIGWEQKMADLIVVTSRNASVTVIMQFEGIARILWTLTLCTNESLQV